MAVMGSRGWNRRRKWRWRTERGEREGTTGRVCCGCAAVDGVKPSQMK